MVNTTSPDLIASSLALQTINAEWPVIKESLIIKKSIDASFKLATEHREKASDAEMECWLQYKLSSKAQGVLGLLIINKTKKEQEFIKRIKAEYEAASECDLKVQEMAGKFESIKHKYDILDNNMAILLRDYRKASAGVDSVQADFITLTESRSVYDEARFNLPNFVYARSLLKNARLDAERMRVKLIDEYSGDGFEGNFLPNDMLTGSESFVDPKTQKDAIHTADTVEKKIAKAFELAPTMPPTLSERKETMDPDGAANLSRRRNAIVIQNAVYRIDDIIENIDISLAYLDPKISSYRSTLVIKERLIRSATKNIWKGILERLGHEKAGGVSEMMEELGLSLRAFLEC
ncbi:hypothetical protein BC829DRAFT_419373 [Chytridium lagenaria]|nr:hypothetical protein BC829DRAFT_419373 [Chytridium lagenaria]